MNSALAAITPAISDAPSTLPVHVAETSIRSPDVQAGPEPNSLEKHGTNLLADTRPVEQ